jgi:hypothetical protein
VNVANIISNVPNFNPLNIMKKFMFTIAFCCFSFLAASAQPGEKLLPAYNAIHLALVNANAPTAAEKAGLLVQAAMPIQLTDAAKATLARLVINAKKISATGDLDIQRTYFAALSQDLLTLSKTLHLSSQPIYQAYCPMKKAYWLSETRTINNPYYGKVMLTCGSITDTIQPNK